MASSNSAAKHPGERLGSFIENFFKTVVGVSTLGASLTFSQIIASPVTPWIDYGISEITVRKYLSLSWLFFTLDLVITSFAASALSLYWPQAIEYFGTSDSDNRRIVMWYATGVGALLFSLLVTAFIFLALVITAYTGAIGWVAVGFTVFFSIVGLGCIVWQSPMGSGHPGKRVFKDDSPRRRAGFEHYSSAEKGANANGYGHEDGVNTEGLLSTADGLRRGGSIAHPLSAFVPHYTEDIRRARAIRTSKEL